jgi:hypothetical protein
MNVTDKATATAILAGGRRSLFARTRIKKGNVLLASPRGGTSGISDLAQASPEYDSDMPTRMKVTTTVA